MQLRGVASRRCGRSSAPRLWRLRVSPSRRGWSGRATPPRRHSRGRLLPRGAPCLRCLWTKWTRSGKPRGCKTSRCSSGTSCGASRVRTACCWRARTAPRTTPPLRKRLETPEPRPEPRPPLVVAPPTPGRTSKPTAATGGLTGHGPAQRRPSPATPSPRMSMSRRSCLRSAPSRCTPAIAPLARLFPTTPRGWTWRLKP
mmetsp:Transcript_27707/g.68191  ORF Transcript_27707/g.68191 Transcript_27707/m.68191 type:complete len:200 (+) Transcript_27707:200-799(+)